MEQFRKALLDKFELYDWFDLAAYEAEETTESWLKIIWSRNNLRFALYEIAWHARKILGKNPFDAPFDLNEVADSQQTNCDFNSKKTAFLSCLGSLKRLDVLEKFDPAPSTLPASVRSLRLVDYLVAGAKLPQYIEQYNVNFTSRFNLTGDVMGEVPEEIYDYLGVSSIASLEAVAPLVVVDGDLPTQTIDDFEGLISLVKDDRALVNGNCHVDLDAPEEVIIADFTDWLRRIKSRSTIGSSRKFSTVSYSKWNKHKILPFFDLMLWAEYRNFHMSNEEIGDLLFPNEGIDRSEKVRKVTKVLAPQVFNYETEQAMRWQLEHEKAMKAEKK